MTIPYDDKYRFCSVLDGGSKDRVKFYFIDYPYFFDRDGLYQTPAGDYSDNAERFAMYSRAVLEAWKQLGVPDVFHCHDWQSALVPVCCAATTAKTRLSAAPAVFTIHNIGYQGVFSPETLPLLTLPWDLFTMDKMEFFGSVNFLKGALVFSDFITTVSRKYARRSRPREYGFGLEGVLRARRLRRDGILNGVDYGEWSPEKDKLHRRQLFAPDEPRWQGAMQRGPLEQFGMKGQILISRSWASSRASSTQKVST